MKGLLFLQELYESAMARELFSVLGTRFELLSRETQRLIIKKYKKKRRTLTIYFWWIFGFHWAYVGKWKRFFLFFFTLGGFFLWALVDFFRMESILREANREIAEKLLAEFTQDLNSTTGSTNHDESH